MWTPADRLNLLPSFGHQSLAAAGGACSPLFDNVRSHRKAPMRTGSRIFSLLMWQLACLGSLAQPTLAGELTCDHLVPRLIAQANERIDEGLAQINKYVATSLYIHARPCEAKALQDLVRALEELMATLESAQACFDGADPNCRQVACTNLRSASSVDVRLAALRACWLPDRVHVGYLISIGIAVEGDRIALDTANGGLADWQFLPQERAPDCGNWVSQSQPSGFLHSCTGDDRVCVPFYDPDPPEDTFDIRAMLRSFHRTVPLTATAQTAWRPSAE